MIFSFRSFDVRQQQTAMKVGTDSVLLGCYCNPGDAKYILDIGAGTGLLSLMMAQKSSARIDAVELDEQAMQECGWNFSHSPWKDRLHISGGFIQQFESPYPYDLIISNPPYYRHHSHMSITDAKRRKARHDADLPYESLCDAVIKHLHREGRFWLVLPPEEAQIFKQLALSAGLHLVEQVHIKPNPSKNVNRFVLCFAFVAKPLMERHLMIYNEKGMATPEYIELTRDFYLWRNLDNDVRLKR